MTAALLVKGPTGSVLAYVGSRESDLSDGVTSQAKQILTYTEIPLIFPCEFRGKLRLRSGAPRGDPAAGGCECTIVELDLVSQDSVAGAFERIRREVGDPQVVVYNAGYLEGRDLPSEKELLEYVPVEMFDTAQHIPCRGPFLVAKEVLPAMRQRARARYSFPPMRNRCAAANG